MKEISKLLEAYNLLKDYCEGRKNCEECVFFNPENDECSLETVPSEWYFCRYSKDEVQLAKVLKKYGVGRIIRDGEVAYWGTKDRFGGCLPKGMFENIGENEEVSIDEVIGNLDL